ncbi:hypothetical protein ACMD2_18681 [Ananas comosus]|uniref:NADH-ubiquinone oxidoreductase 21kDa subunit N-terminal domain-containing protein n=1 Tax=Ananas comosus TaxID=4615 RepID=A0A199W4F4_ANACO|nr:hypothetical protein ACMD2_18681 [Ananas comosus]
MDRLEYITWATTNMVEMSAADEVSVAASAAAEVSAAASAAAEVSAAEEVAAKAVANFSALDYFRFSTITAVSVTGGYLSGIKPSIRGPSMVSGVLIGIMGGFMYAYQNSAGRLTGFFPNDAEVARYRKK